MWHQAKPHSRQGTVSFKVKPAPRLKVSGGFFMS
jgi:hypothetical protein